MRKFIFLSFCSFWLVEAKAQISIYDCNLYQNAPITQSQIEQVGYEFNRPCVELDNTFNFSGSSNKAITSPTSIHIKPGFYAGNYNADGGMFLKIQPKADFDVAVMNYSDINEILKLKKFELGVELPMGILEKVNNFVNDVNTAEKINPYLDWDLRVVAEFTFLNYPLPNGEFEQIEIDGFYSKDFSSQMTDILPTPNNNSYYEDWEYWQLGSWSEITSEYPFRIRFAPPIIGDWQCVVKIYAGTDIYESNSFNFKVVESNSKGYVHAGSNGRFLSLGTETFIPIGCNMPWPATTEAHDPELDLYMKGEWPAGVISPRNENYRKFYVIPRVYEKYKGVMNNLIDNGANYFRTIMYPTGTEIEWEELGNYTKRLHMAQEMDKILELAEQRNAYIHWDMQIHYSFQYAEAAYRCAWTWDYQAPGGVKFCYRDLLENDNVIGNDEPVNFFSNEESKKYYKQRLRYILARYGYSTNISVFELFSEISNVGSAFADNSSFYSVDDNWTKYRDWQVEMAEYIKNQYNGKIHMITGSYAGAKVKEDNTFSSSSMDLSTSNIYDYDAPSFSDGFWNEQVAEKHLNDGCPSSGLSEGYNTTCSGPLGEVTAVFNPKPFIFSETGPISIQGGSCASNYVEPNRSMWQGLFSGLAGELSWDAWYRTDNYAIFDQMKRFIADIDFDSEQWHPGATDRDALPLWFYNGSFTVNMESDVADLAYLRSGDGNYAIGVITNKKFNGKNYNSCIHDTIWSIEGTPIEFQDIINTDHGNGLKLRDMHADRYFINYFLPSDLSTPIHSADDQGPIVKLELNIGATEETYIVLFKARRENHDWLSTNAQQDNSNKEIPDDPIVDQNYLLTSNNFPERKPDLLNISVFPVPSSDKIYISIENYSSQLDLNLETMDGKIVKTFQMKSQSQEIDISNYERGTYSLKFISNGRIIKVHKIVKL